MEAKSCVVKSKSSNSPKTNLSAEHRNKKSWSNAEFQPSMLKKRGVYVEKKPDDMSMNATAKTQTQDQEKPVKAPPRPRAGNKLFLDSVLTILSKSTTGTQHPETGEAKKKLKKRNVTIKSPAVGTSDVKEIKVQSPKKTSKYRSKVLNDEINKQATQEPVVVLRSQKEMVQTPSMYSENDSYNWSKPVLVKTSEQNRETIDSDVQEVANQLAREIMEGRQSKKKKRTRIDEPATLVGESAKKELANKEMTDKDKRLYNFFVDLLETTISTCNVKAGYDKTPNAPSEGSSVKIPLEMDESVAQKLNIRREKPEKREEPAPSNQFYCLRDLEYNQWYSSPSPRHGSPIRAPRKKKFKAESFSFLRNPTPRNWQSESVAETKKPFSRKQKKKTLLNLFKEQLRMDENAFEEPQNLYEALRVIAQNKRRCQKTIHFEGSSRKYREMEFPDCMLKRRKVISSSTKSTKNKKTPIYEYTPSLTGRYSEVSSKKMRNKADISDYDESYHSLEVYGYDYEGPMAELPNAQQNELVFMYNSNSMGSEDRLGSNDVLDFADSDTKFFTKYQNY